MLTCRMQASTWKDALQKTLDLCIETYESLAKLNNIMHDIRATRNHELRPELDSAIVKCQTFGIASRLLCP